jgi:peptidoglycan biosynthesis protein MviN/MurJ (putative lipid II flippase)
MEERGLALATAVCAAIQVTWLSLRLTREVPEIDWRYIGGGVVRTVAATGIMALLLAAVIYPSLGGRLIGENPPVRLAVLLAVGVATFALAAKVMRIEELATALRRGRDLRTIRD